MNLTTQQCPLCRSDQRKIHSHYSTQNNGERVLYECQNCFSTYSQTKNTFLEDLVYPVSTIALVLQARTEGLGLNASVRTFNIAKNTILNWEKRFARLKPTFLLYATVKTFINQIIEGDECYTKVNKNTPPDESLGWTVVLLDRASRFVWEMSCGKKEQQLFIKAMEQLCKIIDMTDDVTLLTDGERRYSNILFDICQDLTKPKKRGRPPKTFPKDVRVKIKNKGNQKKKRS